MGGQYVFPQFAKAALPGGIKLLSPIIDCSWTLDIAVILQPAPKLAAGFNSEQMPFVHSPILLSAALILE